MQLIKMGPCGGDGGGQRDMDMRGVTRIVKIAVRSGQIIDAVSFLYDRSGALEWGSQWGGSGGSFNVPIKMGPCGGHGGDQRDMDMRGVTRIAKIALRCGGAIDAVSFLYERSGNLEWTPQWGGAGGGFHEINLARDEYLTNVIRLL
ncbi:horcolin-like [Ananas comosus]|uniref:Horcolin-like n=1 Tax=Ananas comosus TaxID=4615 RepID=A0A6P5F2R0_ANACO|nr:horcolin-like [Ananas comosus]